MNYYSLDLQIEKDHESPINLYRASILENGDIKATDVFELRHDLKFTQMLDRIEEKVIIPIKQPKEKIHIEFGKMLYNAVFSGELGDYFNRRFITAQERNCGLRVSMQFSEDIPKIAALPWEYLHNGEEFIVTKRSILLSRLPAGVKKTESKPLSSVLRMLVVISSPDDPRISPLNTEKEQEIILEALDNLQKEQKIKVDFTEDATFENIQSYLNEQDYHIVHFTGHGISDDGKGYLVFETEDRKANLIDNITLANLFSNKGIRLVVLSSCESAKGSNKEAYGDIASVLLKYGIPAVVAMQYSVLDDVAIQFAFNFYKAITNEESIDLALEEARTMMKKSEKSNGLDFATPVLYLSDFNCVRVKEIKPEPAEFETKHMVLHDLQVMKTGFVARNKELRNLERDFRLDVKRVAIIQGLGGMGKTVLATRFTLKMNEYFDGIFGMKCNSTTRPEDILNKLSNFLIMNGSSELNRVLNQQLPLDQQPSLEDKTSLLVDILNQQHFLIILDNFEDCLDEDRKQIENPELKAFIQHLLNNTTSNTKFIITARYDFDPLEGRLPESIEHISLPELHFPQTNWLMNNYTELADLSIRKKKQIYNVIGGHPWAVGQFAMIASIQSVDSLLRDLKPLERELMEFTMLEKSFSRLDLNAKKLLLYASVYEDAVPVEALSWMIGNERDKSLFIEEQLQKLTQWGLVSKEEEYDQTVYMEHTIVRNFARKKLEENGVDNKKLLSRAAKYYENIVSQTGNLWDNLKARDYYFEAEDWKRANKIVENTSSLLVRLGHIELAMNLLKDSINTTSGEAKTYAEYTLATIYYRLGDLNTALKIYNNTRYKCEEEGDNRGIAGVLHAIGMIHQDQGNYKEAVKLCNQSLNIKEELRDKSGTAITLHLLGNVHYLQGNYEEAVKLYNQSMKIAEELGDKSGTAITLHQLGMIHQDQGNYKEAVKLYNQSLKIEEELGDKRGIAQSLHQLGMIHQQQGNYEEAVKLYNQSIKIKGELGDKIGIAQSLHQLGMIHQDQGNYEEAVKLYNQSIKIKGELGDKSGTAITLHQLGMIHQKQGNYEEAVNLYNQSLKIAEDLGDKRGIAVTLGQLGRVHEDKEEYKLAILTYLKAFSIFNEINSPDRKLALKLIQKLKDKVGEEEFNAVFKKNSKIR